MIDQFKIVTEQPWLLCVVIPVFCVIGYMVILLIKQLSRLFTEKYKK
jgi:hypothetical protein